MKTLLLLVMLSVAMAHDPTVKSITSSSFQVSLRPTFTTLDLTAQTVVTESIALILLLNATEELKDVQVVVNGIVDDIGDRRLLLDWKLPKTILTFAVVGHFRDSTHGKKYLDSHIYEILDRPSIRADLRDLIRASSPILTNVAEIFVYPEYTPQNPEPVLTGPLSSKLFNDFTTVDIIMLVATGCVLLVAAALMVTRNRHARGGHGILSRTRRMTPAEASEQSKVRKEARLHVLQSSARSTLDMISIHNSGRQPSWNMTPKLSKDEASMLDDGFMSPRHNVRVLSDPMNESLTWEEQYLSASTTSESLAKSERDSRQNLGRDMADPNVEMSSSHANLTVPKYTSACFQQDQTPTASEDSHDVFHIDVDKKLSSKVDDKSIASRSTMGDWTRTFQVIPSDKSIKSTDSRSVMTPNERFKKRVRMGEVLV